MVTRYLMKAMQAKGRGYDAYNDGTYFGEVFRSLAGLIDAGPDNLDALFNLENWDLNKLINDSRYRKPRIYLHTEITSKDNLALEWYPYHPDRRDTDFIYFSHERQSFGHPANRLAFVTGFGMLISQLNLKEATPGDDALIEAVAAALGQIKSLLSHAFEVSMVTELELAYEGEMFKRKLIGADICNVKEREQKYILEKLQGYFVNLGLTPEIFLQFFQKGEGNYSRTAKLIAQEKKLNISPARIKEAAKRLFEYDVTFYHQHCSYLPTVEAVKAKAKIFQFPGK